jgi:hypothetical protein
MEEFVEIVQCQFTNTIQLLSSLQKQLKSVKLEMKTNICKTAFLGPV